MTPRQRNILLKDVASSIVDSVEIVKKGQLQSVLDAYGGKNPLQILNVLNQSLFKSTENIKTIITPMSDTKSKYEEISPSCQLIKITLPKMPVVKIATTQAHVQLPPRMYSPYTKHRTVGDIAQEIIACIANCNAHLKQQNDEVGSAIKGLKFLETIKRLDEFIGLTAELPSPKNQLDAIVEFFKQKFDCMSINVDPKQLDQLCFQRFQVLSQEFIIVAGGLAEHQRQLDAVLLKMQ